MTWIQKNLNENKLPLEGKYSLELVYGWSPLRLSILVIFPVILSFGVGLGYMLETGDAGGAWTIASYVVTAAGGKFVVFSLLAMTMFSSCLLLQSAVRLSTIEPVW